MAPKAKQPAASVQTTLTEGTTAAQANILLDLIEYIAEAKPVQSVVSDVCKLLLAAGKGSSVIRRLAYDAVAIASLNHDDWAHICQALGHDLVRGQVAEVQLRALELVAAMPELHVQRLMEEGKLEERLLDFVAEGAPDVQGAAAVALAHCYAGAAFAAPLFIAPRLLERAMAHWIAVVDIISDSAARVVHSGVVAIDKMIAAYLAAVNARAADQNEGLQAVLAHFAWAGAIRLRSAGAHVLDRTQRMPAALQVDTMAALSATLTLIMSRDPPVRLDAYGGLLPNPNADDATEGAPEGAEPVDPFAPSPPGSPGGASGGAAAPATALHPPVSDGWIFNALGTFCLGLVDAPDAAVATEAARCLLHLRWLQATLRYPRLHVAPVPGQWPRSAVSALLRVGEPLDATVAREAATQVIARYLCVLEPCDAPPVARKAMHWVAQRASASARVSNLLLVWRAVVDVDLSIWRRAKAEALVPEGLASPPVAARAHGGALIHLLEDPMVKALRAGDVQEGAGPGAQRMSPTLNQEVVATLLEVLLTHEAANAAIEDALARRQAAPQRDVAAPDLQRSIDSAALLEARLTAIEWAQIALIALSGTQGCLGWDKARERVQGSYAATVTSDKWLVLASRTQHVLAGLRRCQDLEAAELPLAHRPLPGAPPGAPPGERPAAGHLARSLSDALDTLQGMFQKILKFWRALSPASMPRALWVVTHHLKLPAVQEDLWAPLLDTLRELLIYQPLATTEMHTQELEMSTRNGALPYSVGAQGVRARDRPLLFGGHLLHMPEAIDWWDACAEGLYMGLMALDRICQVLYANFAEHAHLAGYQRLARSLAAILKYAKASLPEVAALQGHCARLADMMLGLTSALDQLEDEPLELPEDALYAVEDDVGVASPRAAEGGGAGAAPAAGGAGGAVVAGAAAGAAAIQRMLPGQQQGVMGSTPAAAAAAAKAARAAPPPPGQAGGGVVPATQAGTQAQVAAAASAAAAQKDAIAAQQGGVKKERSSSVLVSGSKGLGNMLGLRGKKKKGKPEMANIHQMHSAATGEAPPPGAKPAAPDGAANGGGAVPPAAAAASAAQRAAPPPPNAANGAHAGGAAPAAAPSGRGRHVFKPGSAPAAPATRAVPARPGAQPAPAPLPAGAAMAAAAAGITPGPQQSQQPPPQQPPARPQIKRYIGPQLAPLQKGLQPPEGYPFGAPTSITLNESVRCKRHIVFESQLTSSQQQIWEAYRDPSVRPAASHTLAELLATVGTMPAPAQLARSIDPSAVLNVAGGAVLAVPGHFVEVTSGHEPVRMFARVDMDWPAMHLVATFRMQSMLEADVAQVSVRVQVLGAATWVGMPGWTLQTLPAQEATTRAVRLAVVGSGALVLQPVITYRTPIRTGEGVERLEVATAALRVPVTLQLKEPRVPLPPAVFFQRFHTWHYSAIVSGTCVFAGAKGALAVLDIIEKKPFQQIYLRLLPALGGYQAAYLAYDTTNRAVGLLVTAQLVLTNTELSPLTADAVDMAEAAHAVLRITAHTASPGAAASMREQPAHWLRELTDGAVHMAVAATHGAHRAAAPLLSNKYAHAAVQFYKDLTPDDEAAAAAAAAAAEAEAAENGEAEKGEKKEAKGMQEAAAGLAALAARKAKREAAEAAEAEREAERAAAKEAGAAEPEPEGAGEIAEQTGDDWLHIAVLSHWQQMHDAAVAAA